MGNRLAQVLAIAVAYVGLAPATVHAAPPVTFGGWDFSDWFPAMFEQATEAYNALAPVGYLIMGAILAGLALEEILRLTWAARRGPDEEAEED